MNWDYAYWDRVFSSDFTQVLIVIVVVAFCYAWVKSVRSRI